MHSWPIGVSVTIMIPSGVVVTHCFVVLVVVVTVIGSAVVSMQVFVELS
jgi:hypothetical protein